MVWTLTSSGAAIIKAGAGAAADLVISGATLALFSNQVEAQISALTRKDWVGSYASLGANFKEVLSDLASDMIAMKIINYDMSGYTSRQEATTMLDVLRDNLTRNLDALKDDKIKEVID